MTTTDFIQRSNEAVVAALDTRAGIVALTGKTSGNVVPLRDNLEDLITKDTPAVIAYSVVVGTRRGEQPGDFRQVQLQFTAVAATEAVVNALGEQVERGLTCVALAALSTPLDARVVEVVRSPVPSDAGSGIHTALIDVTLIVKFA